MPDPNLRRDKALEDIARSLKSIDRSLDRIAKGSRSTRFTNHPYLEGSEKQDDGTPSATTSDYPGPYGTGTSQPYS